MLVQNLLPHKTLSTKTACERFCVAVLPNSVNGQFVNIWKTFQTRLQRFGSNKKWVRVFDYPALEGVDTLMNLLFMVQSFGLLFESLCTHYLTVLVSLQLLRPYTLILEWSYELRQIKITYRLTVAAMIRTWLIMDLFVPENESAQIHQNSIHECSNLFRMLCCGKDSEQMSHL